MAISLSTETEPACLWLINNRQLVKMQRSEQQGQTWAQSKRQKHEYRLWKHQEKLQRNKERDGHPGKETVGGLRMSGQWHLNKKTDVMRTNMWRKDGTATNARKHNRYLRINTRELQQHEAICRARKRTSIRNWINEEQRCFVGWWKRFYSGQKRRKNVRSSLIPASRRWIFARFYRHFFQKDWV